MNLGPDRTHHHPADRPGLFGGTEAPEARPLAGSGPEGVQEGPRRGRQAADEDEPTKDDWPSSPRRSPRSGPEPSEAGNLTPVARRSRRWPTVSRPGRRSPVITGASSTTWPTAWPATTTTHRISCKRRCSGSARASSAIEPGSLEGWLARIVTNVFLDEVRRRKRRPADALPEDPDRVLPPRPPPTRSPTGLSDEIQAALAALPEEFRVRRRALRRRRPVLRGDRRIARRPGRHRPVADPPRPPAASQRPREHRGDRMNTRPAPDDRLSAYLDGELDATERDTVDGYLAESSGVARRTRRDRVRT